MNKIRKIIILLGFLILVVTGYVFYNNWQNSKMGLVSFENIAEQEIDGKKYIENKGVGFRFVVPEGWEVIKSWDGLAMHTADYIPMSENSIFIPQKGCWIEVYAKIQKEGSEYDLDYSSLKYKIEDKELCSQYGEGSKYKCEVLNLSGLSAFREDRVQDEGNKGSFVNIGIPYKNKVYQFASYFFGDDKEVCFQEFDKFLTTIIIEK